MINTETLQQELEYERQLDKIYDTNGDMNPYKEMIVNNAEKDRTIVSRNGTVVSFEQHAKLHTV